MQKSSRLVLLFPLLLVLIFGIFVALATSTSTIAGASFQATKINPLAPGLKLSLSISNPVIFSGDGIVITISESNTLRAPISINFSSNWRVEGLSLSQCGTSGSPFAVGVVYGFYTAANVSSAEVLDIFAPTSFPAGDCAPPIFDASSYIFQPQSSIVSIVYPLLDSQPQVFNETDVASISANGYLPKVGNWTEFQMGTYTVVGGDEWGNLLLLHFEVST